jgi:hypothetical protein
MLRLLILVLAALAVTACGDGSAEATSSDSTSAASGATGQFTGKLGEQAITVDVTCQYLDQDYFMFKSDLSDSADSNGDGLVISGMQNGEKLVFTVIDHGTTWSVGRLAAFSKDVVGNSAMGAGTLHEDGGSRSVETAFEVDCG